MHSPTHLLGEGHLLISSCETVASSFTTVTPPSVISNWTYRSHFTSISCKTFTSIHLNLTLLSVIFQQTKDWKVILFTLPSFLFLALFLCFSSVFYFVHGNVSASFIGKEKFNFLLEFERLFSGVCMRVCACVFVRSTQYAEGGVWWLI